MGRRELKPRRLAAIAVALLLAAHWGWAQQVDWQKRRITLTLRDTNITAALQILTQKAGLNIVSGPDVKGTVSVQLVDVPLEDALNAILNVNGFGFVAGEHIIKVLPLAAIGGAVTRTYPLNHANADELESSLGPFISQLGSIKGDPRSNTLIVTDIPDNLAKIEELVERLDVRPQQIYVEAHVVDVVGGDRLDFGIKWETEWARNPRNAAAFGPPDLPVIAGQIRFGILKEQVDVSGMLAGLAAWNVARIISSPRILALNHERATIHIGQEIPYQTVAVVGGAAVSTVQFKKVGTVLSVVPHVTRDGMIRLEIEPEQSYVTDWRGQVPVIDTRKTGTELILTDGQTAVIGGLEKDDEVRSVSKIPLLGDIPILGHLFRRSVVDKNRLDLLIFVTPRIVASEDLVVGETPPLDLDKAAAQVEKARAVHEKNTLLEEGLKQGGQP
jgi:type IV pilus assembly protein PilQ